MSPEAGSHSPYPEEVAAGLATLIHSGATSTGDRARLRRLVPGRAPDISFHRFIVQRVPEAWQGPAHADAWKALIQSIAAQSLAPHDPTKGFGRALLDAGVSERRLEAMLAAEGRTLQTLVMRACGRLANARQRCDWRQVAQLLFAEGNRRERINERIARDYFRAAELPANRNADGTEG